MTFKSDVFLHVSQNAKSREEATALIRQWLAGKDRDELIEMLANEWVKDLPKLTRVRTRGAEKRAYDTPERTIVNSKTNLVMSDEDAYNEYEKIKEKEPEWVRLQTYFYPARIRQSHRKIVREIVHDYNNPNAPIECRVKSMRETLEESEKRQQEIQDRLMSSIQKTVSDFTTAIKLEWTKELLSSTFALPDGTQVTWGSATVEQHEARIAMFEKQAGAAIENAARHRKAIQDIQNMKCNTLEELVR